MRAKQSVSPAGMSLVEVLVALGLFALLSILGVRAIDTMGKQGERLDFRQTNLAAFSQIMMLFESDLENTRIVSANLGQAVSIRIVSGVTELEIAAAPERIGSPLRYVRWVLGRDQTVRRYPDRDTERNFSEWKGVITRVQLTAIQGDRKVEWSNVRADQPVQAVEIRFGLQDNTEIIRLIAIGSRSL